MITRIDPCLFYEVKAALVNLLDWLLVF